MWLSRRIVHLIYPPTCRPLRVSVSVSFISARGSPLTAIDNPELGEKCLGTWAVTRELRAKTEALPESARLTLRQLIICRLGKSD
jgi:hypothetical protein